MKLRNAAVFTIWAFVMGNSQPLNAQSSSPWTFYNESATGSTEWTPGRQPIRTQRTPRGAYRFDPNRYGSHYDWVRTEQYRRDHILPHVVPHQHR